MLQTSALPTRNSVSESHEERQHIYFAQEVGKLQDLGDAGHENIMLIFLDWEKAFGKINQSRLMETLEKMKYNK